MENKCAIVYDLLALYHEGLLSEESKTFVSEHIKDCPQCASELKAMQENVPVASENAESNLKNAKPLRKTLLAFQRQQHILSYCVIVFFVLLGLVITEGEDMMYCSIIMPLVGIFGYFAFGLRALYKTPLILLLINTLAFFCGMSGMEFVSIFGYTLIYGAFVIVGVIIAFSIHYSKKSFKTKKLSHAIPSLCISALLICSVLLFSNAMLGNPLSKHLAQKTADEHLALEYKNTDYEIKSLSYSFKDGNYYAHIKSPTSIDGDFTLRISMSGKLISSDYASRVLGHSNVCDRLSFEYRQRVSSALENPLFPYSLSICYGDLEFESEVGEEKHEDMVKKEFLANDVVYDMSYLGKKNGTIVLYVDNRDVSSDKAAEILLKATEILSKSGITFRGITLVLQYPPYNEGSYDRPNGGIRVEDFPFEDIYPDGLKERIISASKAN